MPHQTKALFPHLEGAAGSRRAAIRRRAGRVRKNLRQTIADLHWLNTRLPQYTAEIQALITDLEYTRTEHIREFTDLIEQATTPL